jgi:putative Holliday junction resolvase
MTTQDPNLPNILGIDYGETHIGLALGVNDIVSPLKVVMAKDQKIALFEINRVVIENKIGLLVLGLPLTAEGKETKESLVIRRFAKTLKTITKRPVVFQNEFGTSKAALKEALDIDIPMKKRALNDHLAAALILKEYFNETSDNRE